MAHNILLIDDDADDRQLFCEALEAVAPTIVCNTAANGRIALAGLDNKEIATPDLIFLDINMQRMSGWQFLTILKEHDMYRSIPVIIYSTSSHKEDIERAQQLGALCFFTKPDDYKKLKKSLAIVAGHLHNNSLPSIMDDSPLFIVPKKVF